MVEVRDRLRAVLSDDTFAGRFEALREIGRGGMGTVHRAIDRTTQQPVAIKLVHAAALQARFTLEAETLERLSHPAIVSYVGHGVTSDGGAYLAMAWIDGESLADRLARGPLSVADTLGAAIPIASALAHAHRSEIVHRDLKPSNVMLVGGDPSRAVLIDFGIAKDTAVTHGLTETGQLVGTPGYMSPEQAMGHAQLDARTDMFAFGALLYHCLVGHPPFDGKQPMEILAHLLLKDPAPIRDIAPAVPPRLASLVDALLTKEPKSRTDDAAAVEAELTAIAAALASADTATLAATSPLHIELATGPTLLERPRPIAPRTSRVPRLAAGIGLLAVLGVGYALTRDGTEPPRAVPVAIPVDAGDAPPTASDDEPSSSALKHVCQNNGPLTCELLCFADDGAACRAAGKLRHAASRGNDVGQRAAIDNFLLRGCTLGDARACVLAGTWIRRRLTLGDTAYERAQWIASFDRGCELRDGTACTLLAKHLSEELPTENFEVALGYYERGCEYANSASCLRAAEMLGRRGDTARAAALREIACKRGHTRPLARRSNCSYSES